MLAKESRLGWNLDIIRIDRVVLAGLGVLAGLTWFDWEQVPESLSFLPVAHWLGLHLL